jgi:hypothetical protein
VAQLVLLLLRRPGCSHIQVLARHRRVRRAGPTATLRRPAFAAAQPILPSIGVRRMRLTLTDCRPLLLPVASRSTAAAVDCSFPGGPLLLARRRRAVRRVPFPLTAARLDFDCSLLLIYRVFVLFLFHNSESRFGTSSTAHAERREDLLRNELSRHKPRVIDPSALAEKFVLLFRRCCPSALA